MNETVREENVMEKEKTTELVFSPSDVSLYEKCKSALNKECEKMAKGAIGVASALSEIYAGELFRIDGYTNIYDYAEKEHELSRGMVSNVINICKRFAVGGKIPDNIKKYGTRALVLMKDYTDRELFPGEGSIFNITPEMKSKEIVDKITDYEAEEKRKKAEKRSVEKDGEMNSTIEPESDEKNDKDEAVETLTYIFPDTIEEFRKFFNENRNNIYSVTVTMK